MSESLIIDRKFRGVGRIKVATGTTNPVVRRKMGRMLTALFEEGRLDILRAIRDRALSIMQVFAAWQTHELDTLPTAKTAKPLAESMKEWIDGSDFSAKHKESLETSRRYFVKAKKDAAINDLPELLEGLRNSLGKDHPRSFNLCIAAAARFVRATLKKSHPLYVAIRAVELRPESTSTRRRPLTPEMMANLFPNRETDATDAIAWGMAETGMHAKEYWGKWHVAADRVHIGGTKRVGRVRDVPLINRPAVPAMHRRTFEDKVRERTRTITVYDLRRTYANWLESAGIPRTRRRIYMGHGEKDVTDLYEVHEVQAYLTEDAAKIRAFLDRSHTKAHTMKLVTGNG